MAGEIDTQQVITDLLPALHSDTRANLTWWTETDLIEYIDEGLKRLARIAAVFVERDTSQTTGIGTATYSLPARHVATLHVSWGTAPLVPANELELESLDPAYQTTQDVPAYWYEDRIGLQTVGLAPVPNAAKALGIVHTCWPPVIDIGKLNTLVQAPAPVAGYLAMVTLSRVYGREGEAEMPDVAKHCAAQVQLYEAAFQRYFGVSA